MQTNSLPKCEDCSALVPVAILRAAEKPQFKTRPFAFRLKVPTPMNWTAGVDGRWWCETCVAKHTIGTTSPTSAIEESPEAKAVVEVLDSFVLNTPTEVLLMNIVRLLLAQRNRAILGAVLPRDRRSATLDVELLATIGHAPRRSEGGV